MSSRILVALMVRGTPARAFAAFTEEIGRWWRPNTLFTFTPRDPGRLSFEPGAGGRLISTLATGKVFEIGQIREWAPPHRLRFGWRQAAFAPGHDTEVEVSFEAVDDGTRITVQHVGWDSVPADHIARHGFPPAVFLRRHAEWWRDLLDGLRNRIDQGST